ncbi:hypothetical protein [Neotamlana laminarinivorans]|uniref:Colicin import membrane protein n=1 Tax=Neotamlana laminarinivorans TaxID=2883124 RepID=A0A9X1HYZ6_9FLAO|nr:hypothetical protein [Tamlana laminarinivorans]MCB4798490.1 hypothetical protein [Tamlana laminarinivorans]
MKYLMLALCLSFSLAINAQKVKVNKQNFEVKGDRIFNEGKDVTETLSVENKNAIKKAIENKKEAELAKQNEKAKKEAKKIEKQEKAAENKRKKAEKTLAKKEKAQANFDKAKNNLEKAQKKRTKLKEKGKLSPVDEAKWDKKIGSLEEKVEKTKKKLK